MKRAFPEKHLTAPMKKGADAFKTSKKFRERIGWGRSVAPRNVTQDTLAASIQNSMKADHRNQLLTNLFREFSVDNRKGSEFERLTKELSLKDDKGKLINPDLNLYKARLKTIFLGTTPSAEQVSEFERIWAEHMGLMKRQKEIKTALSGINADSVRINKQGKVFVVEEKSFWQRILDFFK